MDNGIIYIEPLEFIETGKNQKIVALVGHNTLKQKKIISPADHIFLSKIFNNDIAAAAKSFHMEQIRYMGNPLYAFVIERNGIDLLYELAIQLEKKFLPLCGITGTFPVVTGAQKELILIKTITAEPWTGN
jgi:hypothetical protein